MRAVGHEEHTQHVITVLNTASNRRLQVLMVKVDHSLRASYLQGDIHALQHMLHGQS